MTVFEQAPDQINTEVLLRRVMEMIANAKSMPLSASVLISKDEVLQLMEEALDRLPDELRQARWMLKERQEFLEKVQRESDEILESARTRSERMVQRTEIVREAQHTAQRTLEEAREQASRLRHDAEDYCDQKLAAFEIVLERTAKTVQAGRQKLRVTPLSTSSQSEEAFLPKKKAGSDRPSEQAQIEETFFDQEKG